VFYDCRLYDSVRSWEKMDEFNYSVNGLPVLPEGSNGKRLVSNESLSKKQKSRVILS
jgi:hypothetical protein